MIKEITLRPSRIGCPSIPGTMKGIVQSLDGVSDVKIHYEKRSLDVIFDDEKISPEEIVRKIGNEMGLAMEVVEARQEEEDVSETCPM